MAYKVSNFLLIATIVFFLCFALYSQLLLGRVLNFGDESSETGYENHFEVLNHVQNGLFLNLFIWVILTFHSILAQTFKISNHQTQIGLIAFVLSIVYIVADPFGLISYYVD